MMSINIRLFSKILKLFSDGDTYLQIVDPSENNTIKNCGNEDVDKTTEMILKHFSKERDVFINFVEDDNLMESLTYCWDNKLDACVLMENTNGKLVLRFPSKQFISKELFLKKIYQSSIVFMVLETTSNKFVLPGSLTEYSTYTDSELLLFYKLKDHRRGYENALTSL